MFVSLRSQLTSLNARRTSYSFPLFIPPRVFIASLQYDKKSNMHWPLTIFNLCQNFCAHASSVHKLAKIYSLLITTWLKVTIFRCLPILQLGQNLKCIVLISSQKLAKTHQVLFSSLSNNLAKSVLPSSRNSVQNFFPNLSSNPLGNVVSSSQLD